MTGVSRAILLLAFAAIAGAACATKVPPADPGEPFAQPIVLEDVPRHVDEIMADLQKNLLKPVRDVLRNAPVSTKGMASDGSYGRWITIVSESLVTNSPLPKNIDDISQRAYHDLAQISGASTKPDAAITNLGLLARRLHVYFEKQSAEARKTAASYFVSAFTILG
jgi:hypothetical protein